MKKYRFCPICKSKLLMKKHGTVRRITCSRCNWVHYANPLPSVAAFVCTSDKKILLIKRGAAPGKGKWALPSGFIEQHELPEHAVVRELQEETHIRGRLNRLIGVYTEPTRLYGNVLLIGYALDYKQGNPKPGTDTKDAKFFPAKELPKIIFKSHRAIINDGLAQRNNPGILIEVLKSKITEAFVTHTQLFYKGSMGIDAQIMKAANLVPGEKVHVLNYSNGERLITYTIVEKAGSRRIVLYGPASRRGKVGDKLCILSYAHMRAVEADQVKSTIIVLDERNRIKRKHI